MKKRKKKHPEPFYRRFDGWFYVQIGKQQIKLARGPEDDPTTRDAAWKRYHEVMAEQGQAAVRPPLVRPTVTAICNLFLDHSKKHNSPETYEWYRHFLEDFCSFAGGTLVEDLEPRHVTAWLDLHPDWTSARRAAITCVKRVCNWAESEGHTTVNPVKKIKKPPARSRSRSLTPEERQAIVTSYPEADSFRLFLSAMEQTGARPGEVARVSSENVDLRSGVWEFDEHKTAGKTGETRTIILTPAMITLTKQLTALVPEGTPLFRNSRGKPWNRNAIRCRFRRIRKKLNLGDDVVAYLYRHGFCTDLLEAGMGVVQVCELLGHKSTDMVMKHYSKIRQKREHLREQVMRVAGANGGGGTPTPRPKETEPPSVLP